MRASVSFVYPVSYPRVPVPVLHYNQSAVHHTEKWLCMTINPKKIIDMNYQVNSISLFSFFLYCCITKSKTCSHWQAGDVDMAPLSLFNQQLKERLDQPSRAPLSMSSLSRLVWFFKLEPNARLDKVLIPSACMLQEQQCEIEAQEDTTCFMEKQKY